MSILGKPAAGTYEFHSAAWGANATPAPDSLYMLDEGTGTVLTNIGKDAGSHNGTINGATWGTASDSAILTFDGVDDFASWATAFGITAFPFTISVVCRMLSDAAGVGAIFQVGDSTVANIHHGISHTATETARVDSRNTTLLNAAVATSNLFDGSYHVLTGVFVSATSKIIYYDATLTAELVTSSAFGAANAARLGSYPDSTPSNFSNIAVAAAMVWKGVGLSAAQAQTDVAGNPFGYLLSPYYSIEADLAIAISLASDYEYLAPSILGKPVAGTFTFNVNAWGANSTPAPDSFFAIDEGTGTTLTNIGKDVGSYDGTISGATWGTEFGSPILTFDGSNDFVSFAGSAFGITAYPCTIALVCRTLSDFTVFKGAFALAGAGASVNHVICITSLERIQIRTQNTTLFTSGASSGNLFDGSYHVLVMVLASATSKIGYHGASITTGTITDNIAIGTLTAARLGSFADSSPSDWANIAVASAMVWKGAALSAAQIQTDLAGNPFGFLTPKITLAVADLASGFAVDSTALTQANTLSVAALDHAFALDAFALTQANTLAAADMTFGFALDNTVLIAAEISLTVAELVHALSLDNVALTQANTLAVSELLHAFMLDSLGGLTPFAKGKRRSQVFVGQPWMGPTIVPDDFGLDTREQRGAVVGAFALGEEEQPEPPEEFDLVVADMTVVLELDALALTQANTLAVTDLAHAFSVDNVVTTFSALLGVDDLLHAFALDGVDLTQAIGLAVQDLLHALTYTEPELDEASALVLSDALFNLLFDEITFSLVTDEPLPLGQQVVATVFKFREASTLFGVIDG